MDINELMNFPKDTVIADGEDVVKLRHLMTPPHLTTYIRNPLDPERLYGILLEEYPRQHSMTLTDAEGQTSQITVETLESNPNLFNGAQWLLIPPLQPDRSFEYFQNVVAILRAPDGCPWDRKQTHQSLRDDFLQEVYELLDGLDRNDRETICEELGDVLLHVVIQAQIALESSEFNMGDVASHISEKLIFRHEHVFGTHRDSLTPEQVLELWEKMKEKERAKQNKQQGLLDGISKAMPALSMAFSYQKRAAKAGFDWDSAEGVWQKFDEEIEEFKRAATSEEKEEELGDLLFCVVNLARWAKVDPETALRLSNLKFYDRVTYVEKRAKALGKDLFETPLKEKDEFWDEYKAETKKNTKNRTESH